MLNVNDVSRIYLGIQGENEARSIVIDVRPWIIAHPQGTVSIWHKRNGDLIPSPTGAVFDDDAGTVTWTPTSTDTYVSGEGEAEIRMTEGDVIKKSRPVITGISPAVTGAGVPLGSDWQSYIDEVERIKGESEAAKDAAEDAQEAAEDAQEAAETAQEAAEDAQAAAEDARDEILNMTVSATALPEGSSPTATYAEGHMTFGIPKGDHGYIVSESEQYQESISGTVVPTGTWLNARPDLTQGSFLWIKRTRIWNGGTTTVSYEAYYTAVDGESSTVTIDEQPTQGSQGVPRSGGTYTMIQTKATKPNSATSGNFAALDENGDLIDSGHKHSDYLTQHQDISGKADKTDTVLNTTLSRGRAANSTVGDASFAFGTNVTASGAASHAEGNGTTASYAAAHAEGYGTTASDGYSHAEGKNTTAKEDGSHAEGDGTFAQDCSHAEGYETIAKGQYQHVSGKYNVAETLLNPYGTGRYAEIVGNGDHNLRKNARALDWSGNEYLSKGIYVYCDIDSTGGTDITPIMPNQAISIPASGTTVRYIMQEMTAAHQLIRWNFSSSPENAPPADLEWETFSLSNGNGYFEITNNGGTTSETIQPVFIAPVQMPFTIINT